MGSKDRALAALKIVTKFELSSSKFLDDAIGPIREIKYTMMEKQQELTTAVTT